MRRQASGHADSGGEPDVLPPGGIPVVGIPGAVEQHPPAELEGVVAPTRDVRAVPVPPGDLRELVVHALHLLLRVVGVDQPTEGGLFEPDLLGGVLLGAEQAHEPVRGTPPVLAQR